MPTCSCCNRRCHCSSKCITNSHLSDYFFKQTEAREIMRSTTIHTTIQPYSQHATCSIPNHVERQFNSSTVQRCATPLLGNHQHRRKQAPVNERVNKAFLLCGWCWFARWTAAKAGIVRPSGSRMRHQFIIANRICALLMLAAAAVVFAAVAVVDDHSSAVATVLAFYAAKCCTLLEMLLYFLLLFTFYLSLLIAFLSPGTPQWKMAIC